ncbi:hypothetical protein RUND412_006950 [Rhizina undulata]
MVQGGRDLVPRRGRNSAEAGAEPRGDSGWVAAANAVPEEEGRGDYYGEASLEEAYCDGGASWTPAVLEVDLQGGAVRTKKGSGCIMDGEACKAQRHSSSPSPEIWKHPCNLWAASQRVDVAAEHVDGGDGDDGEEREGGETLRRWSPTSCVSVGRKTRETDGHARQGVFAKEREGDNYADRREERPQGHRRGGDDDGGDPSSV